MRRRWGWLCGRRRRRNCGICRRWGWRRRWYCFRSGNRRRIRGRLRTGVDQCSWQWNLLQGRRRQHKGSCDKVPNVRGQNDNLVSPRLEFRLHRLGGRGVGDPCLAIIPHHDRPLGRNGSWQLSCLGRRFRRYRRNRTGPNLRTGLDNQGSLPGRGSRWQRQ